MSDPIDELIANARSRKRGLPTRAERKAIRTNARVGLRELGAAVGVSAMAIYRWETDNDPRQLQHLERYRRALDGLAKIP